MMRAAAMQNQQQQTFFDNLARGIQNYQRGQAMDMKKRQIEAQALEDANDPKKLGQDYIMSELMKRGMSREEAAANLLNAKSGGFDPWSGTRKDSIFDTLGLGKPYEAAFQAPSQRMGNTGQGQGTNPAITTPYDEIQPIAMDEDDIYDAIAGNSSMQGGVVSDAPGVDIEGNQPNVGGRLDSRPQYPSSAPKPMQITTEKAIGVDAALDEYAGKKGIDLRYLNAEQKQKLMFEKELAEQKTEMMKRASMPSKIAESDNVFDDIGKAINLIQGSRNDITPPSGTAARLMSMISESKAGNLNSLLSTVQSGTGLNKLQSMREASPTGASGLGALNKSEMKILQDIAGEMQISTDTDILEQNLKRYYNTQMDLIHGTPDFIEGKVRSGELSAKEAAPYLFRYNYKNTIGKDAGGSWSIKRVR